MIGEVRFATQRGEPAAAILDAAGRWHCPQLPVLDRVLNALFDPHRVPAAPGPFGHAQLRAVAAWLRGTAQVGPPPMPAGGPGPSGGWAGGVVVGVPWGGAIRGPG